MPAMNTKCCGTCGTDVHSPAIQYGPFVAQESPAILTYNGRIVDLGRLEHRILYLLMKGDGLATQAALNHDGNGSYATDACTRVRLSNIRSLFKDQGIDAKISALADVGYLLILPNQRVTLQLVPPSEES